MKYYPTFLDKIFILIERIKEIKKKIYAYLKEI